jgi:protein phosphatase
MNMEIKIPDFALVLLVGPSGSGKSHFAHNHFQANEVISQERFQDALR